jgi:hypothetical protein
MPIPAPSWWPPKVGDRLRRIAPPGQQGDLWHVVATFQAPDEPHERAVARTWWPGKQRWHYQVIDWLEADVGLFRQDGPPTPAR